MTAGKECTLPLLRVASRLFTYISDTLQLSAAQEPVKQEHGLLLRQLLLPVPEYCQEVPAKVFEGRCFVHLLGQLKSCD